MNGQEDQKDGGTESAIRIVASQGPEHDRWGKDSRVRLILVVDRRRFRSVWNVRSRCLLREGYFKFSRCMSAVASCILRDFCNEGPYLAFVLESKGLEEK